jgi:hypothetical protein
MFLLNLATPWKIMATDACSVARPNCGLTNGCSRQPSYGLRAHYLIRLQDEV